MATDADVDEDKRLLYHLFFAHLNLDQAGFAAAPPPPAPKRAEPTETEAAALWTRLERRTPGQRIAMVEEIGEFQSHILADLVAAKSRERATVNPEEARELADLAQRISAKTY